MPKKGYKQTPEHREKNRQAKLGCSAWNKGTKGLMKPNSGSFKKGNTSWLKGKKVDREAYPNMGHLQKHSEETIALIRKQVVGKLVGEKHWNWQGGKNSENYRLRRQFRRIQKQVFERDDYTCLLCNKRGGSLQVDHIKSWSEYPELRFDTENCRTLCMACHYRETFNRELPEGVIWGHNFSRRIAS